MRYLFSNNYSILLVLILSLFNCNTLFSRDYRIVQNGETFDIQLSRILNDINSIPGNDPITIRIDKGYYPVSKTIQIQESKHRILFCGSRNGETIISGSIKVERWDKLQNGLWRSHKPLLSDNGHIPDQLFVNGVRAHRSKIPKDGFFILQDGIKEGNQYKACLFENDTKNIHNIGEGESPILTIFRHWTVSKRYLKDFSPSDNSLYFAGKDFPEYNKLEAGNGLVLENSLQGIDLPGEWCADKNGYVYYKPKEGELIESTDFRIPITETLFAFKHNNEERGSYSFKNIIFEHTCYHIPPLGSEFGQAASRMSAVIELDNVDNTTFEDCEIRNTGNYGIWFRYHCTDSEVSRMLFRDLGAGAIKIGTVDRVAEDSLTNYINVNNSIIFRYGVLMENAVGIILFHASDCKIVNNDIHYGSYSGISLGWVWGYGNSLSKHNEVAFNRISHIGTGSLNDLGGIYTLGKSEGTHIHHNVISDVISRDFRGWGIYADEGTSNIVVDKNLVYNCTSGGFHLHYGSDNVVTNNIFAWGEKSQFTYTSYKGNKSLVLNHNIFIMRSGALLSGGAISDDNFFVGNNCYWSLSSELPKVDSDNVLRWIDKKDSTSVYKDPHFRNPHNADFRFTKHNICKEIGFEKFDYSKAGVYGRMKRRLNSCYLLGCENQS